MNTAKFLRLAPTLILASFLAYSSYSMQATLPGAAEERAELSKGLDAMVQDILSSGTVAVDRLGGELRDPFQVGLKPGAPAATQDAAPPSPEVDPLAEIVRGLKLDATVLHGRDQIAIIDGRIYSRGQHLRVDDGSGPAASPLFLLVVQPSKVILRADSKNYVLGYPDQLGRKPDSGNEAASRSAKAEAMDEIDPGGQLALFQKLLNSPLGALGKSMIGKPSPTDPASRASRRNRSLPGGGAGAGAPSNNP
jgi:hypothetical protein